MNNLDRFMEFLLSGVFLCAGVAHVFSYNREAKGAGTEETASLMRLPYPWAVLVGLFEIAAALTLLVPSAALPSFEPALVAATALALLMVVSSIYRVRRQQSAAPTVALFLMALFVIAAHCL